MHSTVSNEGMIWPKMCSSRYRYCLEEKMKGGMGQGSRDTLMEVSREPRSLPAWKKWTVFYPRIGFCTRFHLTAGLEHLRVLTTHFIIHSSFTSILTKIFKTFPYKHLLLFLFFLIGS